MAFAALAEAPLAAPYARVKQYLKEGLAAGRWTPGALMPSEAELVAAVRRQPHDGEPRAARAAGRRPGRSLAGRRHLRRASSTACRPR